MDGPPALAPDKRALVASGGVGCPSPAPGPPWRVPSAQPGFCGGRYEGTASCLGRRAEPPRGSAIATTGATDPHEGCGAATRVAPADSKQVRTPDRLTTAPACTRRKKTKTSAL